MTQVNSGWLKIVALSVIIGIAGCGDGGCQGGAPQAPEERPIPREAPAGSRRLSVVETGVPLGAGVALPVSGGASPRLLALGATAGQVVVVDAGGTWRVSQVAQEGLTGLYGLPGGGLTLAPGSGRLLRLVEGGDGAVTVGGEAPVGEGARVVEVVESGGAVWVLSRGEESPLVRVELPGMEVGPRVKAGATPVDIEASLDGSGLFVANLGSADVTVVDARSGASLGSIGVDARPWRLVAGRSEGGSGRMYVLHANSGRVTALDTASRSRLTTAELPEVVTSVAVGGSGRWIYGLAPGAGALMVLDGETLAVSQTLAVPVGSSEVVRVGEGLSERLLVSTGARGELWVLRPEGPSVRQVGALALDAAAGRIAAGSTPGAAWLIGPQVGRVGLFHIE